MFWRKRITAIASEYPDVELSHMYVDNAAMQLIRNPKQVINCAYFIINLHENPWHLDKEKISVLDLNLWENI